MIRRRPPQSWNGTGPAQEAPLRAELFTADQMAQHGKRLAALHESALMRTPDQRLPRLADNERMLLDICTLLAQSDGPQRCMTPAGEWLLYNLYADALRRRARLADRRGHTMQGAVHGWVQPIQCPLAVSPGCSAALVLLIQPVDLDELQEVFREAAEP